MLICITGVSDELVYSFSVVVVSEIRDIIVIGIVLDGIMVIYLDIL